MSMTSRHNRFGLGGALSLAVACLTFNTPARAQDEFPAEGEDTAAPEEAASEAPEAAPEPQPEPEEQPAAEPEAESEEPSADASAGLSASASLDGVGADADAEAEGDGPTTKADAGSGGSGDAKRDEAVMLVGVEQLHGSAFPAAQVRGIKYGSLWRTFHGQQWPYMPEIGGKPGTRIGISGGIWNDLSNAKITVDKSLLGSNIFDQDRWTTQSRGVLRLTPTYNAGDGWFVQGRTELVAQGDMNANIQTKVLATTDDLFVRVGKWNLFDVTFGRFQGWEIANHYGLALDQNTLERFGASIYAGPGTSLPKPTDGYGLSYFWDRKDNLLGGYAVHIYPTDYLRAEILGHIGVGDSKDANNPQQMDIRPSLIFDIGWAKVKGGWEYGKASPQDQAPNFKGRDTKNGFGFAAQFVLDPYVEFGGSFARGFQDILDNLGQPNLNTSNTVQTFGGFLNASPMYEPVVIGLGAFWNHWEDLRYDLEVGPRNGKVDTNDQRLLFAAVQYTVWDRLYLKLVAAHAKNTIDDFSAGQYTNTALSGRFRAEFLF